VYKDWVAAITDLFCESTGFKFTATHPSGDPPSIEAQAFTRLTILEGHDVTRIFSVKVSRQRTFYVHSAYLDTNIILWSRFADGLPRLNIEVNFHLERADKGRYFYFWTRPEGLCYACDVDSAESADAESDFEPTADEADPE
jgi:hypothetical protein